MWQTLRKHVIAIRDRVQSFFADSEDNESFSNVVDLVCGKESERDSSHDPSLAGPAAARAGGENAGYGEVLLFQTKAQRVQARIEAQQLHEQAEKAQRDKDRERARREMIAANKLVVLSTTDPRFQQCCDEYFPDRPILSAYLVRTVIEHEGSLLVLRLICSALAKALPDVKEDISTETARRMSVETDIDETRRLINACWTLGGDKIREAVWNLGVKLNGFDPGDNLPKDEWQEFGNESVALDHYKIYTRIFACAYVMLLATKAAHRTSHVA